MAEGTQGKPPSKTVVTWAGDQQFDGGRASGGPTIRLDGRGATGPSPVDALGIAIAGCTGVDIVDILAKRRTPVESLSMEVHAERANAVPARVVAVDITYHIRGAGIERAHAERAIELAVTKYCSVGSSIDPATPIRWTLVLED
ncbi:OsmC family protein [Pseudogemmatithrix spongiicola]|uniref:OsmC family protein n=1 Tax=Pseudogemmatithrix spongiicola TaxID=3062599 RepID=A0AA49K2Q4_9BACT|nr:OsmC family protein [Gemmatimonadaceae bacterium 'strain 138']WKW16253.1 OsmC family protein [Gemmatimonadaceae bacterium 'strain 318']